jgi:hypothetical protein
MVSMRKFRTFLISDAPVKDNGAVAHVATDASHAAFRAGQLGPVKAKFLADAVYNARVEDLARSAERSFGPPLVAHARGRSDIRGRLATFEMLRFP